MLPFMHTLTLALLAAAGAASALPTTPYGAATSSEQHRNERRGSNCNTDEVQILRDGDKLICQGKTDYWQTVVFKYVQFSVLTAASVTVAYWVTSKWNVQSLSVGAPPVRMARRGDCDDKGGDDEDDNMIYIVQNDQEVAVPATVVDDRQVVQIEDWLASMGGDLVKRGMDGGLAAVPLIGGEVLYHLNGTLDTFTLDFAGAPGATNTTLAARDLWTVHTTYWAESGHADTDLSEDDVQQLALHSYTNLRDGTSQVCGYMANSGSWHGAFRHWTGDSPYSVGECTHEREF
ncbi:hypothetical protein RHOSPDRAFT_31056 [Rhodotorula sp. JG-1b]|nr:hypothetical protein RHOSPDRAFT_31056 [Rhodotorula sp. JG-1b]